MDAMDEASIRVLRWRVKGLLLRLGQAALISGLLWLEIRSWLAFAWCGLAMGTALVDAILSRQLLTRLHDRGLAVINDISRAISAVAFTSVCLLMLMDRSGFGLAASILAACAMNLNNAMMTAGVRRYTLSLMTPSSVVLAALPLAAWAAGHPLTLTAAVLLTVGALAYVVFVVRLAGSLFKEGRALRAALEAAEAASRAKSSFLAVTSHEIRTPLNGVLGMAQAMEGDDLSPAQRERVGVIRQSGAALLDLLNDILDLSKIEAGKLDLEHAPFDLEAVVRSAADAFSAGARNKGLAYDLVFDPAARGGYAGDAARIRQVLCNLISNAVKFTETGSVSVAVAATPGGVRCSVTDTGPGVSADFTERLFEKFTQADSSTTRRFGGTGLGLAISRELCEAMGGAISVESPPGGGSTFIIYLPLAQASLAPAADAAVEPGLPDDVPLRVLAAEDNPINQLVLRTLLGQIGVEATIVESGVEALDAWEQGGFDLILMDIQMPRMDGPEASRLIRARELEAGRPRIPIIALTANVMSHQVEGYTAAGMDAFVAKPIAVAELYAAIGRFASDAKPAAAQEAA
jgi:signal transduction histidine kinase